ncbi:serine hydrolase domain-containing protein [Candidatus Enterococcus mansonii]|nr:serine hydrolase [Enterococcus sp. 4G2_DIV0659]
MNFKQKIHAYLSDYQQQGYLNGSLLIADRTGIILEKSYGSSCFEFNLKNTNNTKYQIGSLTKAFTSMAILILHHNGKLSINDTIDTYFPEYPNGANITIYQCMTCTSGIPDFTALENFWEVTMRLSWTLDDMIELFKYLPLDFKPGTQFAYSSSGYLLLTKIIELVSGQSYAAFLKEHIFEPLKMTNTGCANEADIIENLAFSYSYWEKEIQTPQTNLSFPLGAYGLYSTIHDLYRWDQGIRHHLLIPEQLTQLMSTPSQSSYACGWDITTINGQTCRQHFGNISGYVSAIKQFETDELTILFLSNLDVIPVTTITKNIAELWFGEEVPTSFPMISQVEKQPLPSLSEFVGTFLLDNLSTVDIVRQQDELFFIVPKLYGVLYKFKLRLVWLTSDTIIFKSKKINETLTFSNRESGDFQKITYTDYDGRTQPLKKIKND